MTQDKIEPYTLESVNNPSWSQLANFATYSNIYISPQVFEDVKEFGVRGEHWYHYGCGIIQGL
jgi:hypothetical protein